MTAQIEVDERLSKYALRFLATKPEDRVSPKISKVIQVVVNITLAIALAFITAYLIGEGLKQTSDEILYEAKVEAYRFSFVGLLFAIFLLLVFPLKRYQEVPQGCVGIPYLFGFLPLMWWQLAPGKHSPIVFLTLYVCKLGGETFDVKKIPGVMSPLKKGAPDGSVELEVSSSGQTMLIDPVEAIALFGQGGPAGIAINLYDAFSWLIRNALSAVPLDIAELGEERDIAVGENLRSKKKDPETGKPRIESLKLPDSDNRVLYVKGTGYSVDALRIQESMPKDKTIREERSKLASLAVKLKSLTMTREATKGMQNADFMVAAILDFVRDEKMEMQMFEVGPNLGNFLEGIGLDKDSAVAIANKAADALKGIAGNKRGSSPTKPSGGGKKR